MTDKRILALDASTKATGYAVYTGQAEAVQYGIIKSSSQCLEKRITIMRDEIVKLIKDNKIDTIVMEDVRTDGFSTQTARALLWLQGCICVAAWECNNKIKVEKIGPSSWRKILGLTQGRGVTRDRQKQIDIEHAAAALKVELAPTDDDIADAICILEAYLKDAAQLTPPQQTTKLPPIGSEESAF